MQGGRDGGSYEPCPQELQERGHVDHVADILTMVNNKVGSFDATLMMSRCWGSTGNIPALQNTLQHSAKSSNYRGQGTAQRGGVMDKRVKQQDGLF